MNGPPPPPAAANSPSGDNNVPPARPPHIQEYELLRRIGSGSYGDVWFARGLTGVFRAVKVVWRDRFSGPEPFESEFRGLTEFTALSFEASQMAQIGRAHV